MARLLAQARFIIGTVAFVLLLAAALPAVAQQRNPDGSVNPTASAVKEQQLLNALSPGGSVSGRVSIPDQKSGNLIHPAGRDWRYFHEVTLRWIGGIAVLGMLIVLVAFYLIRGQVKLESGFSGRRIVRFNGFERFVHWMTATCFIILAISGLNITFGKPLLMPLIGEPAFAGWSQWAKYAHNYLSFPFTIGVFVIFLMWIAGNIPNKVDVAVDQARRRHRGPRPSAGLSLQRRPEDDLLDRRHRRHGGRDHRLSADVPVLCDRHRGPAACAGRARRHRGAVRRRDARRTSTSAPSAWKAPSRRWARAPSTSTGRRSTTRCGSNRRWRARARTSRSVSRWQHRPNRDLGKAHEVLRVGLCGGDCDCRRCGRGSQQRAKACR